MNAIYKQPAKLQISAKPVSVIICARNEAGNLRKYLPEVLKQVYPEFEVLVVNDHSTDESAALLEALKIEFPQLNTIYISEGDKKYPGKKGTLAIGIEAAKHDLLVLTDADCRPGTREWLGIMSAPLSAGYDLVLGISPYIRAKGLVNALVRYETMLTAIQYAGLAIFGKPYMGVGRNMAYTRELYNKVDGFEGLDATLSGDDDLFVQKVSGRANVKVVMDADAFTWSESPKTFSQLKTQKSRHYSTGGHYSLSSLFPIGVFLVSKTLFWLTCVIALLNFFPQIVGSLIIIHILHSIMVQPLALKLKTEDILWKYPLLDLLYIATAAVSGLQATRNGNYKWK